MCGIVGYVGKQQAKDIVLKGLKTLEYRGYDSAGMTLYNALDKNFDIYKETGRVDALEQAMMIARESSTGIGHTRWATHGKVTKANAHPHVSKSGRFIIVHNGVIENSEALYQQYIPNYELASETDTEIIAHLIETLSQNLTIDNAIVTTLKLLEGSYALLVIDTETPDLIYAAKHKSPLLVGLSETGTVIASDVLALSKHCQTYVPLTDETFVVCEKERVRFFNFSLEFIRPDVLTVNASMLDSDKGLFDHYMLKEIEEQPLVIRNIVKAYTNRLGEIELPEHMITDIKNSDRIYMIAAGTSMHAGLIGKHMMESLSSIPVEVHIASEFAYSDLLLSKKPYFILITQSGETADLRACLKKIEHLERPILTVTNVSTSTLAREATYHLDVYAGPEIAVASTKAYVAQGVVLLLLAYSVSDKTYPILKHLSQLAIAMEVFLANQNMDEIALDMLKKRNAFFIGRGQAYYLALEAALKVKEISYIQTEGFASGELKHGTIALIEEDTPVFGMILDPKLNHQTRSNMKEVEARGAKTCIITMKSLAHKNDAVVLEDVNTLLAPLLLVIPTQLISYYAALQRGFDIDKPRNLAKSVTVE